MRWKTVLLLRTGAVDFTPYFGRNATVRGEQYWGSPVCCKACNANFYFQQKKSRCGSNDSNVFRTDLRLLFLSERLNFNLAHQATKRGIRPHGLHTHTRGRVCGVDQDARATDSTYRQVAAAKPSIVGITFPSHLICIAHCTQSLLSDVCRSSFRNSARCQKKKAARSRGWREERRTYMPVRVHHRRRLYLYMS